MRVRRIISTQVLLLRIFAPGSSYTVQDYGFPEPEDPADQKVFTGNLPSIKMTKETIMKNSPKPGSTMHAIPAKVVSDGF